MDERVLRERKRKFELQIKKYKETSIGSGSDAEKEQIELKIAEAKASVKRINSALDALGPVKNVVPFKKQYLPVVFEAEPVLTKVAKKAEKRPKAEKKRNTDKIPFALPE